MENLNSPDPGMIRDLLLELIGKADFILNKAGIISPDARQATEEVARLAKECLKQLVVKEATKGFDWRPVAQRAFSEIIKTLINGGFNTDSFEQLHDAISKHFS